MASQETPSSTSPPSLKTYLLSDIAATALFNLRLITVVCTILYFLSTFGLISLSFGLSCYLNAMLTSFITFSIRLYQRKTASGVHFFSKEMYLLATQEDSGHYMVYTFFYYNQQPMSIYLIPPALYALMFTVTFSNGLAPFLPLSVQGLLSRLNNGIVQKQQDMRRYIAYAEILMLWVVIFNVLTGRMFFLAPLLHYNFLKWRYQSNRNTSVRNAFSDLRVSTEYIANHPKCPGAIKSVLLKMVSIACSLAPAQHMRREA